MKKLLLSFILGVGFGAFGYAANNQSTNSQLDQKKNQTKVKKVEHYDFSLFKFIAPKIVEEKDSNAVEVTKPSEFKKKDLTLNNSYENDRELFKLS